MDWDDVKDWAVTIVVIGGLAWLVSRCSASGPGNVAAGNVAVAPAETANGAAEDATNDVAAVPAPGPQFQFGMYASSYGRLQIERSGGSYPNGQLFVTRAYDNVVEGQWTGASERQCSDGRSYGRFRFVANEYGFDGRWSYCEGALDREWLGWRAGPIRIYNNCQSQVRFYFHWTDPQGNQFTNGPWTVPANGTRLLEERRGYAMTNIRTAETTALVYAVTVPGGTVISSGPTNHYFAGRTFPMYGVALAHSNGEFTFGVDCPGLYDPPAASNVTK